MKDLYIGDFYNPEEEKESWEDYIKRKKKEEDAQMSPMQKLILIGIAIVAFAYMYNYLTTGGTDDKTETTGN
jgi:hypothetical protein